LSARPLAGGVPAGIVGGGALTVLTRLTMPAVPEAIGVRVGHRPLAWPARRFVAGWGADAAYWLVTAGVQLGCRALAVAPGRPRSLEVYVARKCLGCAQAHRLAAEASGMFPVLRVRVIDVDAVAAGHGNAGRRLPEPLVAVPTYVLGGPLLDRPSPGGAFIVAGGTVESCHRIGRHFVDDVACFAAGQPPEAWRSSIRRRCTGRGCRGPNPSPVHSARAPDGDASPSAERRGPSTGRGAPAVDDAPTPSDGVP
jgi:hypothetical protein